MIISENKDLPDPHQEHHDLEDHFFVPKTKESWDPPVIQIHMK